MAAFHQNIMSITLHLLLMKAATGKIHAACLISALMIAMVLKGRVVAQEVTAGIVIEALRLPM